MLVLEKEFKEGTHICGVHVGVHFRQDEDFKISVGEDTMSFSIGGVEFYFPNKRAARRATYQLYSTILHLNERRN